MKTLLNKFYWDAPKWNSNVCKHTEPGAEAIDHIDIENAPVIEVRDNGAFYRGSHFSGIFLIDEPENTELRTFGTINIIVYCKWFGHRLITRGPQFKVKVSNLVLRLNYDGRIVSDLGKRTGTKL